MKIFQEFVLVAILCSICIVNGKSIEQADSDAIVIPSVGKAQNFAENDIYADEATKRPQITDIIGPGIQNIFQGLLKAPSVIATQVQSLINGVLQRTTPSSLVKTETGQESQDTSVILQQNPKLVNNHKN